VISDVAEAFLSFFLQFSEELPRPSVWSQASRLVRG